ncbi:terminase small subunit [Devriesea agamarum]|uniref:terminase small subunit n=1 Tax=Devriesea agamarum TaxID=472569 RepID=UPI00071CD4E1|nr:hypothetical protein [Devriesea agamarum]
MTQIFSAKVGNLRPLREVVDEALESAYWLNDTTDGAAIELARYYAGYLDSAVASDDDEAIKKAMAISGPNLHKTLVSLGLTPAARGAVRGDGEKQADPFEELRKRRLKAEKRSSKEA